MNSPESPITAIRAYRALGCRLGSAGQPTADQFPWIRDAGFQVVINLALPTSDGALPGEGGLVTSLGMAYVHLPVDFQNPTAADFRRFRTLMEAFRDERVFVHCAANMRVSSFLFVYRVLVDRVPVDVALQDLRAIWEPDDVWHRFIVEQFRGAGLASPFAGD